MAVAGLQDLPLEIFSGLVNDLAASDLPPGASPALSDCAFELGSVLTRPGLGAGAITGLAGNPTVNYLKTFTDLQENQRLLYLDSLGVFRQDFPQGTETIIDAALTPGDFAQSTTLFGREYVAFSDGKGGRDIPRQWDGTNYDRVSQCGPGAPPIAVDGGSSVLTFRASANRRHSTYCNASIGISLETLCQRPSQTRIHFMRNCRRTLSPGYYLQSQAWAAAGMARIIPSPAPT